MGLTLEKKFTAFIDVLGWSNAAAKAHDDPRLAFRMNAVLEELRSHTEKFEDLDISHFSDCIILSDIYRVPDNTTDDMLGESSRFLVAISELSKIYWLLKKCLQKT